jgi:lipoprotein-releasing system permease protein
VIEKLLRSDARVSGVAARAGTQVFFNDGIIDITGMLNGIDVHQEIRLFHFSDYVTEGNPLHLQSVPNSIILGASLASSLRVTVGDRVFVTTPQGQRFALKVSGIFQSGLQEYDKVQSFASLETVQKVMNKSHNYITDLQIRLHDITKAPELGKEFSRRYQTDSEDIQTSNAQFETGSSIRTTISYAVGVTLLIVAGFGIFNILNMMIYEKMDSIAILKATGFSGGDVDRIFTVMALGIGLFGGVFGLIIGFGLSYTIDQIPFETQSLPTITTYPVSYNPVFYIIGFTFSLLTTYLAGWAPARKAARIDPVIIIRGK